MKFLVVYICLISFGLSCSAPYIGYIGKSRFSINFTGITENLNNKELKNIEQPIYASNYGEKDEEKRVEEADYDTFTISNVDVDYASDKNHVYYKGEIIEGIDTKTYEIISTETDAGLKSDGFIKDKNGLYYYGKKLEGANLENYKKIAYYIITNNIIYSKEKKTNYDLNSFEIIKSGMSYSWCDNLIRYRETLVKDKNGVYLNDINIYDYGLNNYKKVKIKIDSETFKSSGNYLYEDKNNYYISRNELIHLLNNPIPKKDTITYYRINHMNKLTPFLLINNNKLFQLVYSYDYNILRNKKLKLEDMEIYAQHYDIILLKFKDEIFTLTEEFLMSSKDLKNIYFPNPRTVVLKSKDKIVVYPSSRVETYRKENGIDINSLIYIEPNEEANIKLEYLEKGVFIDKNNLYNFELKKIRNLKKSEYKKLKKYKRSFENYRLKTLDDIIITK